MKLSGKVALVTGSSRGIGKAIALALAREGASVVVVARTETARTDLPGTIGETVEQIRSEDGKAIGVRCDVTLEEDVDRAVQRAVEEFGGLDILVNNAGLVYDQPTLEVTPKRWDLILRVNVKAPYLCVRAAAPAIAARGGGSIINISSHSAETLYSTRQGPDGKPFFQGTLYGISKAAVDRFSRGLAVELAPQNIAVNALKPVGPVDTEGFRMTQFTGDPSIVFPPEKYMTKAAVFLSAQTAGGVTGLVTDDHSLCRQYSLA